MIIKKVGGGGGLLAAAVPDMDVLSMTAASGSRTTAGVTTIVSPASNTDGMLVIGAHLHSVATGAWRGSIIVKDGTPASYGDADLFLAGQRQSTWSTRARGISACGPVWIEAGYGLYMVTDAAATVNYAVHYRLGANPDATKYIEFRATDNWHTFFGTSTFAHTSNTNGAYLLGWAANAGDVNQAILSLIGSSGNYYIMARMVNGNDTYVSQGGGAPWYLPPSVGVNIQTIGGSGTGGFLSVKIL